MNFITKAIAKSVAKDVAFTAAAVSLKQIEKDHTEGALAKNKVFVHRLTIERKNTMFSCKFVVLDEEKNEKYIIKKDHFSSEYPIFRLYDLGENEIGYVEKKRDNATTEFMDKFSIYLKGKCLGTIIRRWAWKENFDIEFNGWKATSNKMRTQISVHNKLGDLTVRITEIYDRDNTYLLEIDNKCNEILALLILMAIFNSTSADQ